MNLSEWRYTAVKIFGNKNFKVLRYFVSTLSL